MKILVTGGLGFIGSHFCDQVLRFQPDNHIVIYDWMTYAANRDYCHQALESDKIDVVVGDVADLSLLHKTCTLHKPNAIVHFAAESSVDKSIAEPKDILIQTNVQGTYSVLEIAKVHDIRLVYVSTDEVYGSLGPEEEPWTEKSPRNPRNPYSATKAAGEMLVESFVNTYGVDAVITRSSNNYGPRQHKEKFLPTVINSLLAETQLKVPIYGDGKQKRDWVYVEDNARAIYNVLKFGKKGEAYNLGGGVEYTNIDLVHSVHVVMVQMGLKPLTQDPPLTKDLMAFVTDRLGHDRRYSIDIGKYQNLLDLETRLPSAPSVKTNLAEGLDRTIRSYIKKDLPAL